MGFPCEVELPDGRICGRPPYAGRDVCHIHAQAPDGLRARASRTRTVTIPVTIPGPPVQARFHVRARSDSEGGLASIQIFSDDGNTGILTPGPEVVAGLLESLQIIAQRRGLLKPPAKG